MFNKFTIVDRIENGELALYCADESYYPDYLRNGTGSRENLHPTFGDGMDRMIWRTKQSLDFIFLWSLAASRAKYFLQIEDDVIADQLFLPFINAKVKSRNQLSQNSGQPWISLEFCVLGFIGKLFESNNLNNLISYGKAQKKHLLPVYFRFTSCITSGISSLSLFSLTLLQR